MSSSRPQQKLRISEKTKEWKEANIEYWAGKCDVYPMSNADAITLHSAVAGRLDEKLYTYVTNPLSMERPELKGYPAKMRNIDILSPNIQRLMGELVQRYFNPMVVAINSTMTDKKKDKEYELTLTKLKQDFINGLVADGVLPEQLAQTPMSQDIINKTVSNMQNELSKMGQHGLNIIMAEKNIDLIRRKTLYEFIVLGRFFTYKDVHNDDIDYYAVLPMEMSYTYNPNIDFIENSESVKRRVTMSMGELVDKFSQIEGFADIIDVLETKISSIGFNSIGQGLTSSMIQNITGNGGTNSGSNSIVEGITVEHVQWDGMCLMQKVTGVDALGEEYEEHYDEEYIGLPTEDVEEYWVKEQWEGYRIDGTHILAVEALQYQRGSWNNPSRCKKSYNGRIYGNNYVLPQSIAEKGIVYQIKYNIAHYHFEKIMGKNKDKITTLPLGIIPQKEGWDEFTVMYYADAHGYLFIDETNPQAMQALQYIKVLDMSLSQYLKEMYGILQSIKDDWDDSIGFNRQRKGAAMASDGKSVTEEAIYRSSTATEELYRQHEETILADLNGLLPLTQVVWRKGKRGTYLSGKQHEVHYDLDPSIYPFTDYGIVAENSSRTQKKLEMMQGQLGNIAQQTQQIGMLPRIVQAVNMAELVEDLDEMEAKLTERQQAQQQAENTMKEAELAQKNEDRQLKRYEIDAKIESDKEIKMMDMEASLLGSDLNKNGIPDAIEIEKLVQKREEAFAKIQIEKEKLQEAREQRLSSEKINKEKVAAERFKASRQKTSG